MQPFSLSFEPPSHGWLPVRMEASGRIVEFTASDVPNNPIAELCEALFCLARGEPAAVWWHLEPGSYLLHLEPNKAAVSVRLHFTPGSKRTAEEEVLSVIAPENQVLLVLWRFLRRFESSSFEEPHWPKGGLAGLEALGRRIKAEA